MQGYARPNLETGDPAEQSYSRCTLQPGQHIYLPCNLSAEIVGWVSLFCGCLTMAYATDSGKSHVTRGMWSFPEQPSVHEHS